MPHLSFEYSAGVEAFADLGAFADHMRRVMIGTGVFPVGGVRVRGFRADVASVGDGGAHDFVDMAVRMGAGRGVTTKTRVRDALYEAAETFLKPAASGRSFALSLELREIDIALSLKRFNTIRDHLETTDERD